jgi:mannose-6-phosphate isomerase-like protein (cupin superfamily)
LKVIVISLFATVSLLAASADVDVYSPQELQAISQKLAARKTSFASEALSKYGNHYTMMAFREATGSAEVHETEADLFVVVEGHASIVTGGELVNKHTEKAGEVRGSSISGGQKHELAKGAVIHIPAGVPHQLLIEKGVPFTYFVLKVTGQ